MDKARFIRENFKKGKLFVSIDKNTGRWGVYELFENYKDGCEWLHAQRYYLRGEFGPVMGHFSIGDRLPEDPVSDEYIIIKEF